MAVGIGRPDERGMAMSREAAVVAAQRNLVGIIKGVQIDADTLMENLLISNDTVKRKVSGLLMGAQIVDENSMPDGSYMVKMRVPLYGNQGSLSSAVLPAVMGNTREPYPKVTNTSLSVAEQNDIASTSYSGIVVDADGMGLEPTFSPVIYDTNGREIYGAKNIDADFAVREGMVAYANDVEEAKRVDRAGNKPLIVKATDVKGGTSPASHVNVVVSPEDGDRILLANEKSKMLDSSDVVFVK